MCPLRRVEGHRASPSALGILTPPGWRTFLILRPRALSWDLLLLRPDSVNTFREMPRAEADRLADELLQALGHWSEGASGHVEEIACPEEGGFWVRVRVGPFALLVCGRQPGQPYQPLTFPDAETALTAAAQLRGILRPPANVEQEVYLNTHHFQQDRKSS
ncbi:MAG: SPOR domain-containing protein [Gemmataceae bacterium]